MPNGVPSSFKRLPSQLQSEDDACSKLNRRIFSARSLTARLPSPEAAEVLQLGNVTYNQQQSPRGNGLVLLAQQLIAAKLNVANGIDASCIVATIAAADALIGDLVVPPVGTGYLAPRDVSALARALEQYNSGQLCAPACAGTPPPTRIPTSRPRPSPLVRPLH